MDSLLDTVTALIADCDHDSIKRLKTIEAYASRCKYNFHLLLLYSMRVFIHIKNVLKDVLD